MVYIVQNCGLNGRGWNPSYVSGSEGGRGCVKEASDSDTTHCSEGRKGEGGYRPLAREESFRDPLHDHARAPSWPAVGGIATSLRVPPVTKKENSAARPRDHATKVARDWLANELYEPSRRGKIDAACRDRKVADLITAAGASAPADAVFSGRFATGEAPRPTTSASKADEGDGVGGDGGTGIEYFDLFEPDPTPMEDL